MATEKFKALVHFIVHECSDSPGRLGAVRLNKALWYADVTAFKTNGVGITGETYVKRQMGPVPAHILHALRELRDEGKIAIKEPEFQYDPRKFIALTAPDVDVLSETEREIAVAVTNAVCGFTANAISEISHDVIWDAAEMGEELPLYATLAAAPGEIGNEVLKWANQHISTKHAA